MKKFSFSFIALLALFFICSVSLKAQQVILYEEFDSGAGQWANGWINTGGGANVTFSIDNTGKLSGANSYLADIVAATSTTWNIQRIKDCPLLAGNIYTLSFKAVSNKDDASINVLFEIAGDPYTKRLNETPIITTTPQVFTYTMSATEDVPTNQVKLHYGGTQNDGAKIWVDSVVVTQQPDPALVSQWGSSGYAAWPVSNTAATPAGSAGMGDGSPTTGWSSIRGAFSSTLTATTTQAVVVTGQVEFVGGGGGSAYTPFRYSLTYQDSVKLQYQYTDSAAWVAVDTTVTTTNHDGYLFCPMSGLGTMSNTWRTGAQGTVWTVPAGNWVSTNNVGAEALAAVKQAPRNAEIIPGVYDFAISVQDLGNGTNEVRWYMVEKNNQYWFGGTVIDPAPVSDKFNGIIFGVNNDNKATQFNVYEVKAEIGDPIEVPEAPWQAFYVNQWGKTSRGKAWPVLNDSTYLDGDASMGDGAITTDWSSIRGGFGDPVEATTEKAIIVSGQLEYVGGSGGSAYTHLRYALTYQDSIKLNYQYTDSAIWVPTGTSEKGHYGYGFHPISGMGTMSNGNGGAGTLWQINGGTGWNSTWSNNGVPIAAVKNAPRNAEMIAGVYNWAISVRPLGDGTNEVRWSLVHVDKKSYWFGGTAIDTAQLSTKFNGICFSVNKDNKITQFNVYEVKVDIGDPIEVPEAPWQAFYVTDWGASGYASWPVLNDSTYLDGDAGMGSGSPTTGWASIKGGFGDPVLLPAGKALIVTGQMEFIGGGGGSAYTPLRYSLTYQDSVKLQYQYTDSAAWVAVDTTVTTTNHDGYLFCPMSGLGTMSNTWRTGAQGTVWTVPNGNWVSTNNVGAAALAAIKQAPRNAEIIPGVYNFAISVQDMGNGSNEVRWYMVEKNNQYWFGGTVIDPAPVSDKFNGIIFGVNNDNDATQFNVYEVQVDIGDPVEVPEAPWQAYYATDWGFSGGNLGGWNLTPGEFDGDVTIGGTAAPTGWSAVRGGIDPYKLSTEQDRALIVTGKIELVGGGFQDLASLRYGLFYSDSAGTVKQDANLDSNWVWTGTDQYHSGYLFTPPSGANIANWSGASGTWGAITDGKWWDISSNSAALGAQLQTPANAVAGPGVYDFAISVSATESGNLVRATLSNAGKSYSWETSAIVTSITDKINCVAFAIDNSTTTAMNLLEIKVDRGADIVTAIKTEDRTQLDQVPTVYSLKQNYPNPFNPTTTIEFALPQSSEVNLVVFDISGRVVAELAKGKFEAGYHKFNFDASNLASGVYFVKLRAGDFVSVNKAVLVK